MLVALGCKQSPKESNSLDNSRSPSRDSISPPSEPVDFDLQQIKERGSIKAIIDNNSTGYFIYKGQPMGYDYELLTLFASDLGVKLELVLSSDIERIFNLLDGGEGDLIAYNLTVTKNRKKRVSFSLHHNLVRQVLVQKKPVGWRKMKIHQIEKTLIRNPIDLIGKEVYVRRNSAHVPRLRNLSDEIGGDILVIEDYREVRSEELIKKVNDEEIDYTVADENIALVNATYYPDLDVQTPISFPQRISWAVRRNSKSLLDALNNWIEYKKTTAEYHEIYKKYFRDPKRYLKRAKSDFLAVQGGKLSEYDNLIREGADSLEWDWRLLAAQCYQESRFNPKAKSWAGAKGLFQLMPKTGKNYGVRNFFNPRQNVMGAVQHIQWLEAYWQDKIKDDEERVKFVLGSYNAGHGHVMDAVRLTRKYSRNPLIWDQNVDYFLLRKARPEYFNDPVVKYGYCRGEEPVVYVKNIMDLFEQYQLLIENPT